VVRLVAALSNFEPLQVEPDRERVEHVVESMTSRQTRVAVTTARHEELVRRYDAGETVKALAAEFGMHHQTVRAAVAESGVPVRTRERLTAEQISEITRLYEAGRTTTEIGARYGVYASTIQRQLKRVGVPLRKPGWPSS
jgi:DNA-binding NarL/FixJ family response regulator